MKNIDKDLLKFLKLEQLIVISTWGTNPWIFDAYYAVTNVLKLYFVSKLDAKHSRQILQNPNVAFSIVWFDKNNHANRKGIQGKGICTLVKDELELIKATNLHNKRFPEFKSRLTPEYLISPENDSKMWSLNPLYIKFWCDELYGSKEGKEFFF